MSSKKLSRNDPCPCGSGKKYKACCWDKDFEWVEDEAGTVYKSTPMTPDVREALEQLRQAFMARRRSAISVQYIPNLLGKGVHGERLREEGGF